MCGILFRSQVVRPAFSFDLNTSLLRSLAPASAGDFAGRRADFFAGPQKTPRARQIRSSVTRPLIEIDLKESVGPPKSRDPVLSPALLSTLRVTPLLGVNQNSHPPS